VDDDATHAPMFHQIEGLSVEKTSCLGDLRAVLDFFYRRFFGKNIKIRFRPSYFPFVEPGAEVDVSCVFCKSKGCRVCKQSGWLEVAGAGLVHPEVFSLCGWDPAVVQGWAFGMGIERMTMLKLGIPDLRLFFENRLSFLRGAEA
jgi:phenylalanyl-tRNA synthetase alpha chain